MSDDIRQTLSSILVLLRDEHRKQHQEVLNTIDQSHKALYERQDKLHALWQSKSKCSCGNIGNQTTQERRSAIRTTPQDTQPAKNQSAAATALKVRVCGCPEQSDKLCWTGYPHEKPSQEPTNSAADKPASSAQRKPGAIAVTFKCESPPATYRDEDWD